MPWPVWREVVGRRGPVLLAGLALAFGIYDAFVVRPAMVSYAATGRRATGTVLSSVGGNKNGSRRASAAIGVDDAALGWQLVDGNGGEAVGDRVELLCSTPVGRCETAARVSAYVNGWPFSAGMIRAGVLLSVAALAAFLTRRRPTEALSEET